MANSIKKMNIKKFREKGYLQEVNRLFLHPLGLALEISIDEKGKESLSEIWDCRDDPEGIIFGDLNKKESITKAKYVENERRKLAKRRFKILGYTIQPIN